VRLWLLAILPAIGCRTEPLPTPPPDDLAALLDLAQAPDLSAPADLAHAACPALLLDGTGYVTAPALAALVPPASLTVEIWVYEPMLRPGLIAEAYDPASSPPFPVWALTVDTGGGLGLIANEQTGGNALGITSGLTTDHWRHLAGVFDAAASKYALYLDGHQIAEGTTLNNQLRMVASPTLRVGRYPPGIPGSDVGYEGYLAELRISSVARYTSDFVPQKNFEDDADTVALYPFDEPGGTVAHDQSVHHNDATLLEGAVFASPPTCR
jgi:hypothetical protein